jgi:hypothetical protein
VKFWQLESVCSTEPHLMDRLGARPEWAEWLGWHENFARIVREQDRAKLDFELPNEVSIHVLSGSERKYFLASDYVRVRRSGPDDRELSAVDVFHTYGGSILEEVNEAGLARVA